MKPTEKSTAVNTDNPSGAIPQIRRVLVSTDFSPLGNSAIPYAYAMLPSGGEVRLIHVEEAFEFANPIHAHDPTLTPALDAHRTQQLRDCRERLRKLIPAAATSHGVRTEIEIVHEANAAVAICRAAERFDSDLICLASHGRSGISKLVFGSVAQAVLSTTRRPVLVVRPSPE